MRAYLPYAGRWDLTIQTPAGSYPAWMEVSDRDGVVTIVVVGKEGGLHGSDHVRLEPLPVTTEPGLNDSAVRMGDKTVATRLAFTTMESFGRQIPVEWTIEKRRQQNYRSAKAWRWSGRQGHRRARPVIEAQAARAMVGARTPVQRQRSQRLGTDTAGENHWKAADGTLVNVAAGANLRSTRKLDDFQTARGIQLPARREQRDFPARAV